MTESAATGTGQNSAAPSDLQTHLMTSRQACEAAMAQALSRLGALPDSLNDALRYGTLSGGKRIRPALVYASNASLGGVLQTATPAAVAVEMIHCYSLIHDDLPALDNDDLRRGQPTLHRAFDEATAILAGDALQGLAFQILSEQDALDAGLRLRMVSSLARAAGCDGMIAGQTLDLAAVGQDLDLHALENMHRLKTGALIQCSVELGALSAGCTDATTLQALRQYARCIGLAFQVQDDILDVTAETDVLGKTQGADVARNKPTYVSLLGLNNAMNRAAELVDEAVTALAPLSTDTRLLADIARYIAARTH